MRHPAKKLIPIMALWSLVCFHAQAQESKSTSAAQTPIFPKGEKAPARNFTGTVWVSILVPDDDIYTSIVGNVTFEPGARTNWHTHPSGQILLITDGVGYYQEKGTPIRLIRKGDVVKCPPDTAHWHGATPESAMTHIAINPDTRKGVVSWGKPVTDEEYNRYKR